MDIRLNFYSSFCSEVHEEKDLQSILILGSKQPINEFRCRTLFIFATAGKEA